MATEDLFDAMARSIVDGDADAAATLATRAIGSGVEPLEAINRGFVPGIDHVGEEFAKENMFLPELVLAGEAMKAAIAVLEPEMAREGTARQSLGTVVLAACPGDIHDIGKSLVGTMLSASGFRVFDLGVDVPIDTIVGAVREADADILGLSALLTTTMVGQRDTIRSLEDAGLRSQVKVMVGGAPVTPEWAAEIDADGFGEDAIRAVTVAKRLVGAQA
jgi:corrinoid protein of di/trimethylamine methyltransferase